MEDVVCVAVFRGPILYEAFMGILIQESDSEGDCVMIEADWSRVLVTVCS